MDNSSTVGPRTEGMVLGVLLQLGKKVLLPFGGGARYDLAFDEDGQLVRVQCKTASLRNGCLVFNSCSFGRKGEMHHYDGDADLFGVYSPDTAKVYLVPVVDVGRGQGRLRIDPPRNNWSAEVSALRWASKYEVA